MNILSELNRYTKFGEKELEDGTHLIGRAQHIAPQAWLHSVFPGLNKQQIDILEEELGILIPNSYKTFLLQHNGVKLFNTTICFDGMRQNNKRDLNNVLQPFDIKTKNLYERPPNSKPSFFFIGGYNWDGSMIYIDSTNETVHLCNPDDAKSIYGWADLDSMLLSEINRLMTLFDEKGEELDLTVSTLPINI